MTQKTYFGNRSRRAKSVRWIFGRLLLLISISSILFACASQRSEPQWQEPITSEPYQTDTVVKEAEAFFGRGAQGLADVLNRAFKDNGPPDAYIKGEEGGGALGIGLRYGHGTLFLKDGTSTKVYWRGPSIGIDVGGSAAKAFILLYHLPTIDALFSRHGGVEGSLYYVGGVGVNYNRSDDIVIAPVRFGVGWRQGINVGYLHFSPDRSWVPF